MAAWKAQLARAMPKREYAKVVGYSALAIVAVFGLFWLELFNVFGIDDWLERQFLHYATASAPPSEKSRLRIIRIGAKNGDLGEYKEDVFANQAWRAHHAELIPKLEGHDAQVIAFDLYFPAPGRDFEEANDLFADAIGKVRGEGQTEVIVGFRPKHSFNAALEAVLPTEQMGLIRIRGTSVNVSGKNYETRVLLAETLVTVTERGELQAPVRPLSMPLTIYVASEGADITSTQFKIDSLRDDLIINWDGGSSTVIDVEVDSCELALDTCTPSNGEAREDQTLLYRAYLPFWIRGPNSFDDRTYEAVFLTDQHWPDYKDKIIIIGAETESELLTLGPGAPEAPIYGYHVQARVVSDLIKHSYPRKAAARLQLVVFIALLASGLAARLRLPIKEIVVPFLGLKDFPLPLGLFIVAAIYLTIVFVVFRTSWLLFDFAYHGLALVAGYYVVPALCNLTKKPTSSPAATADKEPQDLEETAETEEPE